MLRQGTEVGIIGGEDRDAEIDLGGEHGRERDVAPSQVGGEVDEAVGPSRDADDGDADAGQGVCFVGSESRSGPASFATSCTVSSGENRPRGLATRTWLYM